MCDPITIVTSAFAGVQSALGIVQGNAEAGANDKQQAQFYRDTAKAAAQNARNQYQALSDRESQEATATANENLQAQRQAQAASASARAAAAEGGVSGLSVDALLRDYDRSYLRTKDANAENLEFTTLQLEEEKKGVQAQAKSQVNSVRPQYRGKTGIFSSALQIGSSAVGAGIGTEWSEKKLNKLFGTD